MNALIHHLQEEHGCDCILLGHRPENSTAARLYISLGFIEVGRDEHEIVRKWCSAESQEASKE